MMQTDVKAGAVAAAATNTTVTTYRARVKGLVLTYASGGAITITDGVGGTTVFTYTPPSVAGSINILVPGEGILCMTGICVTTGAGTNATVFYG